MAEALRMQMARESFEKLTREITCAACRNFYKDPRLLACYHFFCRECVGKLVAKDGSVTCPQCERETQSCPSWQLTDGPPRVLYVNRLLQLHGRMARIEEKGDAPCEMCSEGKASFFCQQCDEFICSECAGSHRRMKVKFAGHEVVGLEEVRVGGIKLLPPPRLDPSQTTCKEHNEQCKLYCKDCDKLICRDCPLLDHSTHSFEFVKKSAPQVRDDLKESLKPLEQLQGDFDVAVKSIENERSSISNQGEFVVGHIHDSFDHAVEILQSQKTHLVQVAQSMVHQKLKKLDGQEKMLLSSTATIQNVAHYVQRNLDIVSDEDLLTMQTLLKLGISEEIRRNDKLQLNPIETANIAVKINLAEALTTLAQEKSSVYLFPVAKTMPRNKEKPHLATVGMETFQFVINAADSSHTETETIETELRSLVDSSTVTPVVTKTGRGLYEVQYTPNTRGRHELHIKVGGQTIPSSPLPVFASIPPAQLGPNPVRIIPGLRHPFAAVFNGEQQLLVTESGQHVRLLSKRGEICDFASLNDAMLTGIAVDDDAYVYTADSSSHSLAKFNMIGKRVKEKNCEEGSKNGQLAHPCGLKVVRNEKLYVCDRNNSRIQVFDKELNFLQSFGSHGDGEGELHWPYDMAVDHHGYVFVTDCDNHRIQVFNKEGKYVSHFGSEGTGHGKLNRPMGISLGADGLLYITEYGNHRVSVFTTGGKHVDSLCQYGTKAGECCYPVGIAIDQDGFLYICDQGNNRIQVF